METEKWIVCYNPVTFESFIRHITKHREQYDKYDMGYTDAVDNIESWLDGNKVDAVEVVHGRWEDAYEIKSFRHTNIPVVQCSKCEVYFCDIINNHHYMYNYCPNCGADMRGSEE